MAATEPPTKKAKVEEPQADEAAPKEEAEEPEEESNKELEENDAVDKSQKIKDKVSFLVQDTTLNVADSMFGNMLTCITDGGFQYMLAGARASAGVKSGRYMFEINVVELMHQKQDTTTVTGRVPQPRNFFRVGLSTAGSSLLIGEDEDSVCFDAEGSFISNKKKSQVGAKFERSMNVALLLNLDSKSPNANTVSLFKDGERICQPQALPEHLHGKALFPTITYRNVTVHYNFGTLQHSELPFKCRMLQDASVKDAVVTKQEIPKDGKCTAVFPVGLPDEGTFQWLDAWLLENPSYTELSDRAILDWAQKSGIARLKPYGAKVCNDKPEMGFGLPLMDDKSIQKMIAMTAGLQKRNFVVMEVHANLMKDDRSTLAKSFSDFKKVAMVVTGEPPLAFKKMTQEAALTERQAVANVEFQKKLAEEKRKKAAKFAIVKAAWKKKKEEKALKKAAEDRKKKLQEVLKKREEDKKKAEAEKKKAEEDKKKVEADKKKEEEKAAKAKKGEVAMIDLEDEEAVEVKDEEMKEDEKEEVKEEEAKAEEETKEEEEEEESEEPMEEDEGPDPEPPTLELNADEKKLWFKPSRIPDLTPAVLNGAFQKYSLPEKTEGFDEIKYEWGSATKCAEYLAKWRQEKKVTAKIDDLKIGEWFDTKQKEWTKFLQTCKTKQSEYKAQVAKKAADKQSRENLKKMKEMQKRAKAIQDKAAKDRAAKMKADAKAAKEAKKVQMKAAKEAKKVLMKAAKEKAAEKAAAEKAAKGEEADTADPVVEEPEEEEPEEEEEDEPMEEEETKAEEEEEEVEEEEEEEAEAVDLDALDVFGVEDIFDVGGKPTLPLFAHFGPEDWALMSLRFELNLLVHAFRKDVTDEERKVIHEDNIGFYYQKYFRKALSPAFFGKKSQQELLSFFGETLIVTDKKVLDTFLPGAFEVLSVFVLLTEESRRDRQRRLDIGEEDAKITMQGASLSGIVMPGGAAFAGVQRLPNLYSPQTVRPQMVPSGAQAYGVRPGMVGPGGVMVRPPLAWPQPQQQPWRPVAPVGVGQWAPPRPAVNWGAPQVRPAFAAGLRPAFMQQQVWR